MFPIVFFLSFPDFPVLIPRLLKYPHLLQVASSQIFVGELFKFLFEFEWLYDRKQLNGILMILNSIVSQTMELQVVINLEVEKLDGNLTYTRSKK
jgi:hypothetical protein